MSGPRIKPEEFQEIAETLREGQRVRAPHHCGEGSCLLVSRTRRGYQAFCFRCDGRGFIPLQQSLAERVESLRVAVATDAEAKGSAELPTPREYNPQEWPRHARLWLYRAGFSNDDITNLKFYYCEPMDRVVMPVYQDGEPVYWQARGFVSGRPKYINPRVDRSKLVAKFGSGGDYIALTEDILSAYKIGKVCEAWALMGTTLTPAVLSQLMSTGKPVLIMLDPDAGGTRGLIGMIRMLGSVGIKHCDARMERDPKKQSLEEIRTWIESMPQLT